MARVQQLPTLAQAKKLITPLLHETHTVSKSRNKGSVGLYLEQRIGIPPSGRCLDCLDGEIKTFPLKRNKSGKVVPKETVAITMHNIEVDAQTEFGESRLYKKTNNIVFVSYIRNNDNEITFVGMYHPRGLHEKIRQDYKSIVDYYIKNADVTGKVGSYMQSRTKGQGGKSKKTRAFYFKTKLFTELLNGTYKCE